jgi:hypothetical protein
MSADARAHKSGCGCDKSPCMDMDLKQNPAHHEQQRRVCLDERVVECEHLARAQ